MQVDRYLEEGETIIIENPYQENFVEDLESYLEDRTVVISDSYVCNGFLDCYEPDNIYSINQKGLTSRMIEMGGIAEALEDLEEPSITYMMEAPSGVKNMLPQDWREICVFIDYIGSKISSGFGNRVDANALYLTSKGCWENDRKDYNLLKHVADDVLNAEQYEEDLKA